MSPKAIVYKANSIIYFKGDISDRIFILNEGQISLNSINIETGVDIHELIKKGEFFGVKSALGRYPREETSVVLTNSKVIAFTVPEFEQMVSKNTRVIIKMLKVFSTQLRRIHKQVNSLLNVKDQMNAELGLYSIGDFYLKNKKYKKSMYVFDRYLLFYPNGKFSGNALRNMKLAEELFQQYGEQLPPPRKKEPVKKTAPINPERKSPTVSGMTPVAKDFYAAVNLMSNEKYADAAEIFKHIITRDESGEYGLKARFEIGKCLFHLKKFENCIKIYTALLQKYPKHPDLVDILYYIGQSNQFLGDIGKTIGIFRKLISLVPPANPLFQKINRELKVLERT